MDQVFEDLLKALETNFLKKQKDETNGETIEPSTKGSDESFKSEVMLKIKLKSNLKFNLKLSKIKFNEILTIIYLTVNFLNFLVPTDAMLKTEPRKSKEFRLWYDEVWPNKSRHLEINYHERK